MAKTAQEKQMRKDTGKWLVDLCLMPDPGEGRRANFPGGTLPNSGFLSRAPAPGKMTEEADSASSPLSSPLLLPGPGICK